MTQKWQEEAYTSTIDEIIANLEHTVRYLKSRKSPERDVIEKGQRTYTIMDQTSEIITELTKGLPSRLAISKLIKNASVIYEDRLYSSNESIRRSDSDLDESTIGLICPYCGTIGGKYQDHIRFWSTAEAKKKNLPDVRCRSCVRAFRSWMARWQEGWQV